jgi:hypothetical protein
MKATLMRCGGSRACGRGLTGVVEGAVVLQQHHLAVEVDDLLAHPHELLLGLLTGRPGHAVLQLLLADDVLLLLLDEERVELVELGLQEPHEIRLLGRHRRRRGRIGLPGVLAACSLGLPLGPVPGADELEALLEVLVGQELVAPLRQRLHDLPAEALAELHRRRGRPVAGKKGDFRWVCGWGWGARIAPVIVAVGVRTGW